MLLLYLMASGLRTVFCLIYIPLCFYFIHACCFNSIRDRKFTFHYASTLSGTSAWNFVRLPSIYIPLCFYFIEEPVFRYREASKEIYIPLCFYFIDIRSIEESWDDEFTFHYASTLSGTETILSRLFSYLHSIMLLLYRRGNRSTNQTKKFTFHYASTLSTSLLVTGFCHI